MKFLQHLAIALLLFPTLCFAAPHPEAFISPQVLKKLMNTSNGPHTVLIDASWGDGGKTYFKGHIPGAIHVNTDEIEYDTFPKRTGTAPDKLDRSTTEREDKVKGLSADDELPRNWWNLYPDKYLFPAFADMGINVDTLVVVYGKDMSGAARVAWALLYAGVKDVRLLNGGLEAWKKAGFEVTTTPTQRIAVASFGTDKALHPEYLSTMSYVREIAQGQHPDAVIADIRTRREYDGESAPYSYIPTKGRIKGALWGHAGDGPWTMDYYIKKDGTFRSTDDVAQMWSEKGITADKQVSFYCGTGWRASLAFYFAYVMGWEKISNFDGGWYEWSMGPEAGRNPTE